MKRCNWEERVERRFDGEVSDATAVDAHVSTCAHCKAYLADLELIRSVTHTAGPVPEIADAQFNAFMDGVREGIAPKPSPWRGLWAMASLTAAAFVVAFSAFILMRGETQPVLATEIESVSTELAGATVYKSDDGVTTVWVNMAEDDLP